MNTEQPKQIEDAKEAAVMKATVLLEVAMQTKVDVIPIGEIFIELFDAGYAAARSDGWIAVEDRLPDADVVVVGRLRESGRFVCNSWAKACDQNELWFIEKFSHWQKIEPPQPSTEEV